MPNKTFDLNRIVKSPETSTKMGGDMNRHIYKDFRLQVLTYITKYKKTNNKNNKTPKKKKIIL